MDVLFISACPPYPPHGHLQQLVYHLAKERVSRRGITDLLAFHQHPEDLADVPRYRHLFRDTRLIPEPVFDLARRARHSGSPFPTSAEEAWSPEMWNTIHDKVLTAYYDVVHFFGGIEVYEYQPLLKDLPAVIMPLIDDRIHVETEAIGGNGWWSRRQASRRSNAKKDLEATVYREFSRVVLTTRQKMKTIKALDREAQVLTMPLGVDADFFSPTGIEPTTPSILFVGDFARESDANAALLLCERIFPAVKRNVPEALLFIAGSNPPEAVQKLQSDSIEIAGHSPDLRPLFEQAMVYVCPIREYTGFRPEILQAMAMLTPVVATPMACAGIELESGRDIIQAEMPSDLTRAIVELLKDSHLRLKLQLNSRERIELGYSWQQITDQYEELYQSIGARA